MPFVLILDLSNLLPYLATAALAFLGGLACRSLKFAFTITTEEF